MGYKIYCLSASNNPENVKYVGRTKLDLEKRLYFHLKSIKYEKTYKSNWIKNVIKEKNNIIIKELVSNLNESESKEKEIELINFFKLNGYKLVNGTLGGDGLSNPTKETIEKIKKGCKKAWENKIPYNRGKTMEENFGFERAQLIKEKISEKQRGKTLTDEHRKKISINHSRHNLGKRMRENVRLKVREGYENKKNEPYFNMKKIEKFSKPIVQMDLNEKIIKVWESIKEASEILCINRNHIGDCCNNRRKTAGKMKWAFYKTKK